MVGRIAALAALAVAIVVAIAALLSGCDDNDDTVSTSDVESSVTSAIESGGFDADQINDVSCPSGEEKEDGSSFECTATAGDQDVRVRIDQDGGDTKVATAVYETGSVELTVETDYDQNAATAVSASCSSDAAIVVALGDTFECTVEDRESQTQTITVTAQTSGAYLFDTPAFPAG